MGSAARPRIVTLAALAWSATAAGCAHHAGKQATAGALAGVEQQIQASKEETGQYPLERAGSHVAQGAIQTMTSPESAERLEALAGELAESAVARAVAAATTPGEGGGSPIEVASAQMVRSIERELAHAFSEQLGPHGEGPLGKALVGTSAEVSAAATRGVLQAFFPECGAGEPRCLDRRMAEMAQETAAGAMRGFSRAVAWLLIGGSFLAGVIATLLLVVTLRLIRRRPEATPPLVEQHV